MYYKIIFYIMLISASILYLHQKNDKRKLDNNLDKLIEDNILLSQLEIRPDILNSLQNTDSISLKDYVPKSTIE